MGGRGSEPAELGIDMANASKQPAGDTRERLPEPPPPGPSDSVMAELRSLASRYLAGERPGHTLQPTALVHEAFLRLAGKSGVPAGRSEFIALAATSMRRVLVDHARARRAAKRGGERQRIALDAASPSDERTEVDLLALDESLERLAGLDQRQARIVELRFFGGLGVEAVAAVLGVSPRTVEADWRMARAWLRRELEKAE